MQLLTARKRSHRRLHFQMTELMMIENSFFFFSPTEIMPMMGQHKKKKNDKKKNLNSNPETTTKKQQTTHIILGTHQTKTKTKIQKTHKKQNKQVFFTVFLGRTTGERMRSRFSRSILLFIFSFHFFFPEFCFRSTRPHALSFPKKRKKRLSTSSFRTFSSCRYLFCANFTNLNVQRVSFSLCFSSGDCPFPPFSFLFVELFFLGCTPTH